MTLLRSLLGWIGRHLLVFLLLVAALVAYAQFRPVSGSRAAIESSIANMEAAETEVRAHVEGLRGRAVTGLDLAQRNSLAAIDQRLAALQTERASLDRRKPAGFDLLRAPRDAIVADTRRRIDMALLDQEADFLRLQRDNVKSRGKALLLDSQIASRTRKIEDLDVKWRGDEANIAKLPPTWSPNRYVPCGLKLPCDLADVYRERQAANRKDRANAVADRDKLVATRRRLGEIRALATPAVAMATLEAPLADLTAAATAQRDKLESTLEREARRWYDRLGIDGVIAPALWALAAIILAPFAIRALFYWVLAPLASLQRPIRLLEPGTPIAIPPERSSVSKAITLAAGEELLIRQGFLQSSSHGSSKATQLLLDARFPIASLAAGLSFLTRIRGGPGDTTTVSATHDPFAEISILELPEGAACVLQPRAIAGVVQPVARPLRITSHWRLGTLSAWLTWQLRFLVFHGPADIILAGGRGVRIEPAQVGRSIGQDQLIGFSAGLAYTTGRTETFLPYFFGQESLLKDRIAEGSGLLIAEEAPLAGRRKAGIARGLEGGFDALLKVFGI